MHLFIMLAIFFGYLVRVGAGHNDWAEGLIVGFMGAGLYAMYTGVLESYGFY